MTLSLAALLLLLQINSSLNISTTVYVPILHISATMGREGS